MARRILQFFLASLPLVYTAPANEPRGYDLEEIKVDETKHDKQFLSFVTQPDLDPPKLTVKVYNESALSPGHLFLSPYGIVTQGNKVRPYVGPHIYDQFGELIWSGVPHFGGYNVFDFKVGQVGGQDVLTGIFGHGKVATILDNTYQVHAEVNMTLNGKILNMHALSLVDDGTRALFLTEVTKRTSLENSKKVKFSGQCKVDFKGIEEKDIATGEITFLWSPEDHIALEESHQYNGKPVHKCADHGWDYIHSNAVVKLPDGDFLLSGRHTHGIYKVSSKTGEIVWRFGGKKSDFAFHGHFSGQHDVQCHFQNSTHMLITMLDNAKAPGRPHKTNPFSRGLVVWLNTENMTAEQEKTIDHPYHNLVPGRGNFETLPNGNAFLTWRKDTFISEHTADGKMIMEGTFPSGLKTYRAFKFPWVGRPTAPPDVHSQAIKDGNDLKTKVHVSWNGDTEVASWTVYRTNLDASVIEAIRAVKRSGFETALSFEGCPSFVAVAGFDKDGVRLGVSEVVSTIDWAKHQQHPTVVKESDWLQEHPPEKVVDSNGDAQDFSMASLLHGDSPFANSLFSFLFGAGLSLGVLFSLFCVWRAKDKRLWIWRRHETEYSPLSAESEYEKASSRTLYSGRKSNPALVISGPDD